MAVDETGNVYGRLTVLHRIGSKRSGFWCCQCECGKKVTVRGAALRAGHNKSCGCLASSQLIDEAGNQYGRLTVVEQVDDDRPGAYWLCKCECGERKVVKGRSLRSGHTRSCGCLQRDRVSLPEGEAAFNKLFVDRRRDAENAGRSWELTREQFKELTSQPCHYCGCEPSQSHGTIGMNGDYIYNGLDRVDNENDYTLENVVSCCWACNWAKRDREYREFLDWIRLVYEHRVKSR